MHHFGGESSGRIEPVPITVLAPVDYGIAFTPGAPRVQLDTSLTSEVGDDPFILWYCMSMVVRNEHVWADTCVPLPSYIVAHMKPVWVYTVVCGAEP